ncbi:hypothetical protein TCAL_14446 [Tigriopus californicus]|uniref:Retropepsins domain-containing protein n=1 Tax=Tigriopus californicus TaxID=6832 RepID=A0A553PKK8_TIGCA|nr:hypothetical protein TCAL_14446 [Tigriopus californicus]
MNHPNVKWDEAVEHALMEEGLYKSPLRNKTEEEHQARGTIAVSKPYGSEMRVVACYFCKGKGHFAFACIKKRNYVQGVQSVGHDRPTIQLVINGCKTQALVDTGALVSLLPETNFEANEGKAMEFRAASGSPLRASRILRCAVKIGNWTDKHEFYIGSVSGAILRMDFLARH